MDLSGEGTHLLQGLKQATSFFDVERANTHTEKSALLKILARSKMMLSWERLFGLILVCGSVRLTVRQYDSLRTISSWLRSDTKLPSYPAIQRTIFLFVLRNSFSKSENVALPFTHPLSRKRNRASSLITSAEYVVRQYSGTRKKNSRLETHAWPYENEEIGVSFLVGDGSSREPVSNDPGHADMRSTGKVILPSEWAKIDVAMYPFFKDM